MHYGAQHNVTMKVANQLVHGPLPSETQIFQVNSIKNCTPKLILSLLFTNLGYNLNGAVVKFTSQYGSVERVPRVMLLRLWKLREEKLVLFFQVQIFKCEQIF